MFNLTFRKNLFRLNAGFLILMGGVFSVLDYVGYRTGTGPLGDLLKGNLLALGILEAHGLAFIMGLLFVIQALRSMDSSWHLVGVAVHILLGCGNLLFWSHFVELDIVKPEIAVTAIHFLFVFAHSMSYLSARTKTQTLA